MDEDERAARARQVDEAMSAVRGRAEASRGLVVVESDAYGTITELLISPAAMTVEPERLAAAITRCHERARRDAEAEAASLLAQLGPDRPSPEAAAESQWEEVTPFRITV
ncbi:YbaB/EbfC family nucleoid-associated protein [Nocardia sp. NPDC050406]|uniref:YbaB/EbfC family nucleoid-associated protein n=1 Tax=Nocardia sp. NPDC050406 TaxID=3364318 RepID=UPI0037B78FF7